MMADADYFDNPAAALDNAMRKTNNQLHAAHVDDSLSGTTAVAVLLKVRVRVRVRVMVRVRARVRMHRGSFQLRAGSSVAVFTRSSVGAAPGTRDEGQC